MIRGGIGGANTKTGLVFEGRSDLATFLGQQKDYFVDENSQVFYKGEFVAQIFKKHSFYKFLDEKGVPWQEIISKKLFA